MVLGRKELSTRFVIGVFVLVAVALVCVWSYFFSFGNRVLSFGAGLPFVGPVIWWSWYEIFRLRRNKWGRNRAILYSFVWCVFTAIPSCLLLGGNNSTTTINNNRLGYAAIGVLAIVAIIVLWGRMINRNISWFDRDEWMKGKSLVCLMLGAFLFWNVVLCMVICSLWYWLAFMFVVVIMNDSLSYLVGKRFGKRRISKFYSPNKTWEGLWASVAMVYVVIVLFWCLLPAVTRQKFVGQSDLWWPALFLCAPALLLCNLGDLQFSMHKRIFRIKDYSSVLGQHGGFWDRFDSHTFAFIFWGVCALVWKAVSGTT